MTHYKFYLTKQIDPRDMYTQVQKEEVPFYQWQKWIDAKLERVYLEAIYRKQEKQKQVNKPGYVRDCFPN